MSEYAATGVVPAEQIHQPEATPELWRSLAAGAEGDAAHRAEFKAIRERVLADITHPAEEEAFEMGANIVEWQTFADETLPKGMTVARAAGGAHDYLTFDSPEAKWNCEDAVTKMEQHGLAELQNKRLDNLASPESREALEAQAKADISQSSLMRYLRSFAPLQNHEIREEPLSPFTREVRHTHMVGEIHRRYGVSEHGRTSEHGMLKEIGRVDAKLDMEREQQLVADNRDSERDPRLNLRLDVAELLKQDDAGELIQGLDSLEFDGISTIMVHSRTEEGDGSVSFRQQRYTSFGAAVRLLEATKVSNSGRKLELLAEHLSAVLPGILGFERLVDKKATDEQPYHQAIETFCDEVAAGLAEKLITAAENLQAYWQDFSQTAGSTWTKIRKGFEPVDMREEVGFISRERWCDGVDELQAEVLTPVNEELFLYYDPPKTEAQSIHAEDILPTDVCIRGKVGTYVVPQLKGYNLMGARNGVEGTFVYRKYDAEPQPLPVDTVFLAESYRGAGHVRLAQALEQATDLQQVETVLRSHSTYIFPTEEMLAQYEGAQYEGVIAYPDRFFLQCSGAARLFRETATSLGYTARIVPGYSIAPGETAVVRMLAHQKVAVMDARGQNVWFDTTPSVEAAPQTPPNRIKAWLGRFMTRGSMQIDQSLLDAQLPQEVPDLHPASLRLKRSPQSELAEQESAVIPAADEAKAQREKETAHAVAQMEYEAIKREVQLKYQLPADWDIEMLAAAEPRLVQSNTALLDPLISVFKIAERTMSNDGRSILPSQQEIDETTNTIKLIASATPDVLEMLQKQGIHYSPVTVRQWLRAMEKFADIAEAKRLAA